MKQTLLLLKQEFESSSGLTPEFAGFFQTFKKEFRALLKKEFKAANIKINKGHFYSYGFFQVPNGNALQLPDENVYYFNIGDVRWDKGAMLIRTAKGFDDYTGGSNNYVPLDNRARFVRELKKVIK